MQENFDDAGFRRDAILALRLGRDLRFEIAEPMKFFGEILGANGGADVEEVTVRIDFRRKNPFSTFKFLADFVLELL